MEKILSYQPLLRIYCYFQLGVFEMTKSGLQVVSSPSQMFLVSSTQILMFQLDLLLLLLWMVLGHSLLKFRYFPMFLQIVSFFIFATILVLNTFYTVKSNLMNMVNLFRFQIYHLSNSIVRIIRHSKRLIINALNSYLYLLVSLGLCLCVFQFLFLLIMHVRYRNTISIMWCCLLVYFLASFLLQFRLAELKVNNMVVLNRQLQGV